MATTYGLTANGFNAKPQSVIISETEDKLKSTFGNNINLSVSSIFGQLVGIFSEREALVWQLAEAVYASQFPSGAEGVSVDNILALNNMKKIKALPTRTNPISFEQANGIYLYGLLAKGIAGTLIKAKSIIQTTSEPPLQFKIENDATIQPSINASQGIYLSNAPTLGSFILTSPIGVDTSAILYNSMAQKAQIFFALIPASGNYKIKLTAAGAESETANISFNATAIQIQNAIQTLSGYSSVLVTGNYSSGFVLDFSLITNPIVEITSNTTTVATTIIQSIQSEINNIYDGAFYPYTDTTVINSSQGFVFTFGNGYLVSGQPSSGAMPQPLIIAHTNTLQDVSSVTNIKVINSVRGANAQAPCVATCTVNGPNFVSAKAISVIGTPIFGWESISNELDCITGSNVENDTQALTRRSKNLNSNANGPLQAIIQKVKNVPNVLAAIGDENVYLATIQRIDFSGSSSSGNYKISINGILSSSIPYNATASQVQSAIATITGFSNTIVKGDSELGFIIDFNGSLGGKELPLMTIALNTTGLDITPSYGLPGKSFEITVQGGDDLLIAEAILKSKSGGMLAYGETSQIVFDDLGNSYNIGFSRPVPVEIYVTINLITDLTTAVNPLFNVSSITDIQKDIVDIGNAVGIGGLIIGFGTDGLIGAFNSVKGIISYSLTFGRNPNPSSNTNIQMQSSEVPLFETFLVSINYN